jgi:hypothetical protein
VVVGEKGEPTLKFFDVAPRRDSMTLLNEYRCGDAAKGQTAPRQRRRPC